jgi:MEMO1 family protein
MDIRPSPIAGRWYSAEAARLAETIDAYLEAAEAAVIPGEIVGVVVPHAGHIYSGPVAAHAFRLVRQMPVEVVVVLAPSHFHADGPLMTSTHEAYATPLGTIEIDRAAVRALRTALGTALERDGARVFVEIQHDREHAVEIQLPFLQRVLPPGFRLIPIIMRDQSARLALALGQAIAGVVQGRRALIVGSSDLSHYYPQPVAEKFDGEMLKALDEFDPDGLLAAEADGRGMACGHGALAATLWAARALGATQARVVNYATSGAVSGDLESVVGYGAAVIWK